MQRYRNDYLLYLDAARDAAHKVCTWNGAQQIMMVLLIKAVAAAQAGRWIMDSWIRMGGIGDRDSREEGRERSEIR